MTPLYCKICPQTPLYCTQTTSVVDPTTHTHTLLSRVITMVVLYKSIMNSYSSWRAYLVVQVRMPSFAVAQVTFPAGRPAASCQLLNPKWLRLTALRLDGGSKKILYVAVTELIKFTHCAPASTASLSFQPFAALSLPDTNTHAVKLSPSESINDRSWQQCETSGALWKHTVKTTGQALS